MYQKRPILEKLLRTEGDAAAGEFWQEYGRTDSADRTPSGLDLAVTSKVVFWLYRYGKDAIVDFMKKSRLNRNKPTENYWELTVETALESAIEYFPATIFNLPKEEKERLANWIAWKKEIANKKR